MYNRSKFIIFNFQFLILTALFLVFPHKVDAQVVINEFLPNSSQEWVEFYNSGQNSEDLSNFYFDDDTDFGSDSGSSQKVALSGILSSLQLCYLDLSTVLNNNGDSPTLFNLSGASIDSYTYTSSTADKSYSRVPDGGGWSLDQIPTKSSVSCISLAPTPTPSPVPTQAPTAQPTSVPTPIQLGSTARPTLTRTSTPRPTSSATPSDEPEETSEPSESMVLDTITTLVPSPTGLVAGDSTTKKSPILAIIFIIAGVGCLGYVGYLLYNSRHANNQAPN